MHRQGSATGPSAICHSSLSAASAANKAKASSLLAEGLPGRTSCCLQQVLGRWPSRCHAATFGTEAEIALTQEPIAVQRMRLVNAASLAGRQGSAGVRMPLCLQQPTWRQLPLEANLLAGDPRAA